MASQLSGKVSKMTQLFENLAEEESQKSPRTTPRQLVRNRSGSLSIEGGSEQRSIAPTSLLASSIRRLHHDSFRRSTKDAMSISSSCSSSGRRGLLQGSRRINQHSIHDAPILSRTAGRGNEWTFEGGGCALTAAEMPWKDARPDVGTPRSTCEHAVAKVFQENVSGGIFRVATNALSHYGGRCPGLVLLVCAAVCILYAETELNAERSIGLLAVGFLLLAPSVVLLLRLYTPQAIRISIVDGGWAVSLDLRGCAPISRPLTDLEGFLETFGYRSTWHCLWRNRAGHATSRHGTVHLYFAKSAKHPAFTMSASLQDPLAFFTKMRDVMGLIAHVLADTTADYVAEWDAESVCPPANELPELQSVEEEGHVHANTEES